MMRRYLWLLFLPSFLAPCASNAAPLNELMRLENVYSRGNDDLTEINHETAKIKLELVIEPQPPSKLVATLHYSAIFSSDHPHNAQGGEFWLKQRFNDIEPNLTASKFTYTPGPTGTSLGGEVRGVLFLGAFDKTKVGPLRGRVAVTMNPDYDPNSPIGVDSLIDWGIFVENEKPTIGNISMQAQWKGNHRPSEEMLRLIGSNYIDPVAFRAPFASLLSAISTDSPKQF